MKVVLQELFVKMEFVKALVKTPVELTVFVL
jgi:hypothetical protein